MKTNFLNLYFLVMNVAKKTGDYMSLSLADLKIIALTHDFQLEKCGPESINYENKVGTQKINDNKERVETLPKGFYNPKITNNEDSITDDSEDEWINSNNVNTILKNTDSKLVACFSADFSVQNVLKHMGINIMSLDGKIITRIQTYIFRCRYYLEFVEFLKLYYGFLDKKHSFNLFFIYRVRHLFFSSWV